MIARDFSVGAAVEAVVDGVRSIGDVVDHNGTDVQVRLPRLPRPVWFLPGQLRRVTERATIPAPPPVEALPRCDGDDLAAWLAEGDGMLDRAETELVEAEASAERVARDVVDAESLLGQTRREGLAADERVKAARARLERVRRVVKGGL